MKHIHDIFQTNKNNWTRNFNLHNHTVFSDGQHSVRGLFQDAVNNLITDISITDHDTINAYTQGRAMNLAQPGLNVIPWVEATVKTIDDTTKIVHMLLYFDEKLLKDNKFLSDFEDTIARVRSAELLQERLTQYNQDHGFHLQLSDFTEFSQRWIYPGWSRWAVDHMMTTVIKRKYSGLSEQEIQEKVCRGSESYIYWWAEIWDILYMKNKYDMVNVMAHPLKERFLSFAEMDRFITQLTSAWELDWVEIHYPWYDKDIQAKLKEYNTAIYTGGSDTHRLSGKQRLRSMDISHILNRDFEVLSRKWDLALMIGRMNPPHIGHIRVIKRALNENGRLVLILWSANVNNEKNPFSAKERQLFLKTYFSAEVREWKLILSEVDDLWNNKDWTQSISDKVSENIGSFQGTMNIYGGELEYDSAIQALNEHIDLLPTNEEKITFNEVERSDFQIVHNQNRYDISATALRDSLTQWNYELARKFLPNEIWDLVVTKWKEKNEELELKKFFFVYPPELDARWESHRNFQSGQSIKHEIDTFFNEKYIANSQEDADIIVPVWWDGSMMYARKQFWHLNIPFYPIAAGTKNFIPANFSNPYQLLTEEKETFELELLQAKIYDLNGELIDEKLAMNDVYIQVNRGQSGMITVEWEKYSRRDIHGDGIIIATWIGSSAYNQSEWGKIIPLNNDIWSITDMASAEKKSHVVSSKQTMHIDVVRWPFTTYIDGEPIQNVWWVEISRSWQTIELILPKDKDFRKSRYQ